MNNTEEFFTNSNLKECCLDDNPQMLQNLKSSLSSDSIVCIYESPTAKNVQDEERYLESEDEDFFFKDIKSEPPLSSCSSSIVFMSNINCDQRVEEELHYLEEDEDNLNNSDTFLQSCAQDSVESEEDIPMINVIIDDDIPLNDYLFEICDSENNEILADAGLDEKSIKEEEIEKNSFDDSLDPKRRRKSFFDWLF